MFTYVWEISEIPMQQRLLDEPEPSLPYTGNPSSGKPTPVNPSSGNQAIKHIEENIKDLTLSKEHVVLSNTDLERENSVKTVFDYWKSVLDNGDSRFSAKKKELILSRLLDGFTLEQLKSVVDFVKRDSFWKDKSTIETIFKDSDRVEQLLSKTGHKKSATSFITDEERRQRTLKRGMD